jgi:hypothetical protein
VGDFAFPVLDACQPAQDLVVGNAPPAVDEQDETAAGSQHALPHGAALAAVGFDPKDMKHGAGGRPAPRGGFGGPVRAAVVDDKDFAG